MSSPVESMASQTLWAPSNLGRPTNARVGQISFESSALEMSVDAVNHRVGDASVATCQVSIMAFDVSGFILPKVGLCTHTSTQEMPVEGGSGRDGWCRANREDRFSAASQRISAGLLAS